MDDTLRKELRRELASAITTLENRALARCRAQHAYEAADAKVVELLVRLEQGRPAT